MSPGIEDDIPQSEKRRVTLQDHDARHGDANAYLERHAPALGVGRRLPELSAERKEEIERKIKEAKRVRGSTYFQHAQSANDFPRDRFHAVTKASLVGQSGGDSWPRLPESSPWSGEHVDQYWGNRRAEEEAKRLGTVREVPVAREQFAVDEPYVVGSTAIPQYPRGGGQADHSGQEPALGFENPALEPEQGVKPSDARAGGAAAPSALPPFNNDVEPAPPSFKQPKRSK
jgi:hypothetical protein